MIFLIFIAANNFYLYEQLGKYTEGASLVYDMKKRLYDESVITLSDNIVFLRSTIPCKQEHYSIRINIT